jgi:hypothetical protein
VPDLQQGGAGQPLPPPPPVGDRSVYGQINRVDRLQCCQWALTVRPVLPGPGEVLRPIPTDHSSINKKGNSRTVEKIADIWPTWQLWRTTGCLHGICTVYGTRARCSQLANNVLTDLSGILGRVAADRQAELVDTLIIRPWVEPLFVDT